MTLVDDIGNALRTAINAGAAHFGTAIGKTGANLHVEYGDQPVTWPVGATGRMYIRPDSEETLEEYEDSAKTAFIYTVAVDLKDVRGRRGALGIVMRGLRIVFKDKGADVLDTHFTDSGGNRLAASGEITVERDVAGMDTLRDIDAPQCVVRVRVEMTHKSPEVAP